MPSAKVSVKAPTLPRAPAGGRRTLSIVIPVFNERRHIARTIQGAAAAAASSGFETEFVVVDDGSSDGSGDIAESLRVDVPIRVVRQPNQGRISARRTGLAAAKGGTTGELIKLLPVLDRLERRAIKYLSVTTAQQVEQNPGLLDSFNLPRPIRLAHGVMDTT